MKKYLLFTIMLFCLGVSSSFADRHEEDPLNTTYVSDVSIAPSGQATLTISMKNSVEIGGFEFDLYLPEGMTVNHSVDTYGDVVANASLVEERTDASRHTFQTSFIPSNDYSHLKVLCYSSSSKTFLYNDGEVAKIVIDADESIQEGDYIASFKNVVISNATDTYATAVVNCNITVEENTPKYDKGYTLSLAPLSAESGTEYDEDIDNEENIVAVIKMANASSLSMVEFDIELPEGVEVGQYKTGSGTKKDPYVWHDDIYYAGNYESEDDFPDIEDGRITAEILFNPSAEVAPFIKLPLTTDEDLTDGVYPITLKNIVMLDEDGVEINNSPIVTTYIKIGNPENKSLALEGKITADVNEALAQESSNTIESLDLSKVSEIDGTLTLVDYRELVPPSRPVEVSKVSYARNASNAWGTIFLPYAVSSDENIQYYQLKGTNGDVMTFVPVDGLKAGEPGVFKKADGSTVSFDVENTTISNSVKEGQEVEGFKLVGSYSNIAINTAETPGCYIKDNQFKTGVGTFYIDTFRSYFLNNNPNPAKVFKIAVEDEITGITTVVGELDAKTGEIYSINGARLTNAKGIYIKNGKKYFAK